ncbi:MAG: hypothetical protein MRY63_00950 [Neomegalonema sp.]|nr:hypothetical protein [Neomegalonema sp.]
MSKNNAFWHCIAGSDLQFSRTLDYKEGDLYKSTSIWTRLGRLLPNEMLPKRVLPHDRSCESELRDLPPIFKGFNGLVLVRKDVAEIIQEYNIGASQLHRVEFVDHSKTRSFGQDLYLLNVVESIEGFVGLDRSVSVKASGSISGKIVQDQKGRRIYYIRAGSEAEIITRSNIVPAVDIWRDPQLYGNHFFFYDRLAKAILEDNLGCHCLIQTKSL